MTLKTSDYDLLRWQVDALFVHDGSGRLLRINEPDINPAPRFFLGRSAGGNVWRTRYDLPDELAAELGRLASTEPVASDLRAAPRHESAYRTLLEAHAPVAGIYAGPAYFLPQDDTPSDAVTITQENVSVLETHFDWLVTTLADYAPVSAAVVDGAAVAVCFCSRITARVCEAGVFTEANSRGHGYATEAVRGWAAQVRAIGKQPLYSTSWSNLASQAIAKKLGAVLYGADFSIK
ncbi:MAG: GNAT family N-acetyltransferase [Chloroflexi bacterium]|nr:GNAT family N-acetyltransferase [Chloroflexota bacterium]